MGEYLGGLRNPMGVNILMSECPWCNEVYIKEKIDSLHNCPQEKQPDLHVKEAVETLQESITIYSRR